MKKSLVALMLALIMLAVCACGGSDKNPETPDFETYNVNINLKLGQTAEYRTACKLDASKDTTGSLTVTERNVYKFADALPSQELEPLEGYEWVEVKVETLFSDDNAKEYGIDRNSCVSNYYNVKYHELKAKVLDNGFTKFAVKPQDKAFEECLYKRVIDNVGWNEKRQCQLNYTWYFRIPEGYDGMVIVFTNSSMEWPEGKYVYEVLDSDSLVYRVAE